MNLGIINTEILNLNAIPDKAVGALALRAFGFGSTKIGRMLKTSVKTIESYFRRYDPNGLCKIDYNQKRVITSEMLTGIGISALVEISAEKLQNTTAYELATIATQCVNSAEKIRSAKKADNRMTTNQLNSMIDSLDHPTANDQNLTP